MMYDIASVLFLPFVWCPCMAINNVSVQYNGGFLPDIILSVAPMLLRTIGDEEFCFWSL